MVVYILMGVLSGLQNGVHIVHEMVAIRQRTARQAWFSWVWGEVMGDNESLSSKSWGPQLCKYCKPGSSEGSMFRYELMLAILPWMYCLHSAWFMNQPTFTVII